MTHRAIATAAVTAAALLALGAPADAKSPNEVDPSTVSPTLNPDFAPWSCFEAGSGITCQGQFRPTYEDEPIGLQCDGRDVLISGYGREFMTRWHTADGLATKTVVHLDYPADTFTLAGEDPSAQLVVRGHWNRHYTYPVPGDRSQRVLTEVGAIYLVNAQGQGIIVHDTGTVTYAPGQDFEVVTTQHGVHDVINDPAAFDALVCDALT
jgi:hypothetical protein